MLFYYLDVHSEEFPLMKFYRFSKCFIIVTALFTGLFTPWKVQVQSGTVFNHVCDGICDIGWSPVDSLLAAVNEFGLWTYDVEENWSTPSLSPFENLTSLDFSSDGNYIAVTGCNFLETNSQDCKGFISIFDVREGIWEYLVDFDFEVSDIRFSPDDQLISVIQHNPQERGILIINISSGETVELVEETKTNIISSYAFSIDSQYIVIANGSMQRMHFNGISIWNVTTGQLIEAVVSDQWVQYTDFSTNNIVMFVTNNFLNGTVEVTNWNLSNNVLDQRNLQTASSDNLNQFALSSDLNYLLGILVNEWNNIRNRSLYIWHLSNLEEVFHIDIQDQYTNMLALNFSSTILASSSTTDSDRYLDLWFIENNTHSRFQLSSQ